MLSEIHHFTYRKDGVTESRSVLPVIMNEETLEGLSLDKMSKEEVKVVREAFDQFNKVMKPFFEKYYRRFKRDNILIESVEKLY